MLALTLKPGEQVLIGDDIKVTLIAIRRGQVVLGFDAPPEVAIDRAVVRAAKVKGAV